MVLMEKWGNRIDKLRKFTFYAISFQRQKARYIAPSGQSRF